MIGVLLAAVACGSSDVTPADDVRTQLASLAPCANLGHRGAGLTRVNAADEMQAQIDKGVTAITTDEPGILTDLLGR